ncbi:GNAT family N-acetyltransferase [Paenibacillus aurantiacus]|uniref:GNAT family N-acetyltransferase n=1 Tax=Paenibacillus aurantiacus TaxID=1936118 RepID=A0ABV5KMA6_9BACL
MIRTMPAIESDASFLYQLFVHTRLEEMQAWAWDETMQQQFLNMQWTARQHSYSLQYPAAEQLILHVRDERVGQALVNRTDSNLTLVDITVLPAYRGLGIGTAFIQELLSEAEAGAKNIHLSVLPDNPALRLYERLGFNKIESSSLHIQMVWSPVPTR